MNFEIRRLRAEDAAALAAFYNGLSEASRRTFHPLNDVATIAACEAIARDNGPDVDLKFDLVALDGDRIVGWSFLWDLASPAPVFGLGVTDEYHGRHVGRVLMDRVLEFGVEQKLCKISLTVVQDNDRARGMYQRRGFVQQEAFVGEDALPYYRMVLNLEERAPQALQE